MAANGTPTFEQSGTVDVESPTLIEGFPGLGLVASIAVDQVTDQLGLEYYGQLRCPDLPPVASYQDGRLQDLVRVYAAEDPPVMTLQSDLMIPPDAYDQVSQCVLSDLSAEFGRAIFLAGAPARTERSSAVAAASNRSGRRHQGPAPESAESAVTSRFASVPPPGADSGTARS